METTTYGITQMLNKAYAEIYAIFLLFHILFTFETFLGLNDIGFPVCTFSFITIQINNIDHKPGNQYLTTCISLMHPKRILTIF